VNEIFSTITKPVSASATISAGNAAHYNWGNESNPCDGWQLVRTPELSVILERMPPGASEVRHDHERTRQFFFVLEGELTIEMAGEKSILCPQQGIEVAPKTPHQVFNRSTQDLRFLVISQPPSPRDRQMIGRSDD
jgi:mannose-6-phosphate isomerase-like protein (cupin superfamily)